MLLMQHLLYPALSMMNRRHPEGRRTSLQPLLLAVVSAAVGAWQHGSTRPRLTCHHTWKMTRLPLRRPVGAALVGKEEVAVAADLLLDHLVDLILRLLLMTPSRSPSFLGVIVFWGPP